MSIFPCPHCGGSARICQRYNYNARCYYVFVRCDICGSQGKSYKSTGDIYDPEYNDTADIDAISAWNMRTPLKMDA